LTPSGAAHITDDNAARSLTVLEQTYECAPQRSHPRPRTLSFNVLECRKTNRTQGFMADQVKATANRIRAKGSSCSPTTSSWQLRRFARSTRPAEKWNFSSRRLKIKKFLSTSVNAVKSQIPVALIADLLVQLLRLSNGSSIFIPDVMAVIGVMLLMKEPLNRILGELRRTTRIRRRFSSGFHYENEPGSSAMSAWQLELGTSLSACATRDSMAA